MNQRLSLLLSLLLPIAALAAPEPVIYLSFDADFNDAGPHHIKATQFGDELKLLSGRNGKALFVGGTEDWLDLPLPDEIVLNRGATLELWFQREEWINPYWGGSGFQTLVAVTSDMMIDVTAPTCPSAPPWALLTSMTHYDKEADESDVVRAYSSANSVPPNVWIHGAVAYDPAEAVLMLYMNGEEIDKAYGVPAQRFNIRNLRVGTWFKANQAFRGLIDEIKVYDYVRHPDEIYLEAHMAPTPWQE